MSEHLLCAIDLTQPWLASVAPTAAQVLIADDWFAGLNHAALNARLKNHAGLPVSFVPQAMLPTDMPYEAFISATGTVPTRRNLHDFFNALVWLSFPETKARLNELQATELTMTGSVRRGSLRDAATIFDENAAIFVARDPQWIEALKEHRWQELFMDRRAAFFSECEVWLFGHALLEKLQSPYKAITAHAWPLLADAAYFSRGEQERRRWIDVSMALQLGQDLTTTAFSPLPVAGIPGWFPEQDAGFYRDTSVFRPKRSRSL
jgi:Protein of unknown function (DUF3025)